MFLEQGGPLIRSISSTTLGAKDRGKTYKVFLFSNLLNTDLLLILFSIYEDMFHAQYRKL
jgi:hypothetical protein